MLFLSNKGVQFKTVLFSFFFKEKKNHKAFISEKLLTFLSTTDRNEFRDMLKLCFEHNPFLRAEFSM